MMRNPLKVDKSIEEMLYGKKPTKRKKKTTTKKNDAKKKGIKRRVFKDDFYKLMDKQKGLCANKNCAKHNGVKQKVTTTKDIDHIIPIKLWELKNKAGDPNRLSNLQLLCPACHRRKTAEDRKKIALYKEKHGIKSTQSIKKKSTKSKPKTVYVTDLMGNKRKVPLSKTKVITNIYGQKKRVLKEPWE